MPHLVGMISKDNEGCAPKRIALSRTEAAQCLGVSPITIDRLTKRGLLKPSRATRRPLYSIPELERFLKETTVEVAP